MTTINEFVLGKDTDRVPTLAEEALQALTEKPIATLTNTC